MTSCAVLTAPGNGTAPIETVPETLEALSQNQVMLPVLAFQGG